MKTVTSTALANFKQNKGRNLLSAVAIALTTFLIFVVLTIGFGMISTQKAAVNEFYPTWHIMYRSVPKEKADRLRLHSSIEEMGLRADFGQAAADKATILLLCMDDTALKLNKMELESGDFPKKENEIVVSQGILDELGIQADVGDTITVPYQLYEKGNTLGLLETDEFVISGFVSSEDEKQENKVYAALTSMSYMEKHVPEDMQRFRVMLRIADAEEMTTDEISGLSKEIAGAFEIPEANIVENSEYLFANYVDPTFYTGIAVLVLVVVLAGILTIYSIYYVSMIPKVQEYGRLKALGATKKQIRQIIFREGMLVTLAAAGAALAVSTLASQGILKLMSTLFKDSGQYAKMQYEVIKAGKVPILHFWIYALTSAVVLFTVYVSLIKPMHTAARVSPIEAMRYQGETCARKKNRKGYESLNLVRLTLANLSRNKKRTLITVATLSAVGILFMVMATVLSCADPKEIARNDIEADYRIEVATESGNRMAPERDWKIVQQNNPMNEGFLEKVESIPGVTQVRIKKSMDAELPDYIYPGEDTCWISSITGVDASYAQLIEKGETEGRVSYEELQKGDKILMNETFLYWFPEVKAGDKIRMVLYNGEKPVERTFEIGAIGSYSNGFLGSSFLLPESVLDEISDYNLTYACDITVEETAKPEAYKELESLWRNSENMEGKSYEEYRELWEDSMQMVSMGTYAFLFILGGIGIMNLVNTMLNSIHMRRRELGMLQAIGLSRKQMNRMLQMEGMFYTFGTLVISLGIGSAAGYGVFLYARNTRMLNIQAYHYPLCQAMLLTGAVTALQMLLTYAVTGSLRRRSLIEQIRYSE